MLAPMPADQMQHVRRMVPRNLVTDPRFTQSVKELDEEIEADYYFSLRKGIGISLRFSAQVRQIYARELRYCF